MNRKGVICLGNPLRGDDGISKVLIRELKEEGLPSGVEIFDVGTGGINALHVLERLDKVIIVDAVSFGGSPGDHVFFEPGEVSSLLAPKNSHESDLLKVLELSKSLDEMPEKVLIMGVQPKDTSMGEGLSPKLEEKVPELLDELRKSVDEL